MGKEGGSVMEKTGKLVAGKRERFSQEQKLKIVEAAKGVGIKEAAKLTGIHYTTVYDWKRQLEAEDGNEFPGKG